MIDKSDTDLIVLARAGDKAAFGHLGERYQQMVKRIALNVVRNEHLAQELTQETILQAYLSLDRLRDDGRFKSWLYGIALNVCKSHIRRQKIDFLSLETIMGGMHFDAAHFSGATPDPKAAVEERDLHRRILDAVKALSPKNRTATLLFYYEQLTVREIAALLDISVVAVKGRLHKSRQQLRAKLIPLYSEIDWVAPTQERRPEMIKVSVADVVEKKTGDMTHWIIVLLDEENQRLLMIWVGPEAGVPIALNLLEHPMPRPMTFTFMANLLKANGVELEAVCVDALKEDVFYATAKMRHGDTVQEVDARPSDAINLALCMGSPIFVTETVMEAEGIDIPKENALPSGIGLDLIEQKIKKREQELEEKKRAEAMLPEVEQEKRKDKYEESKQELVAFVLGAET